MSDRPLITVIAAVLNGAGTLPRLIDSVARQSLKSVELVVKDGGSTDGTVGLLETRSGDLAYWESSRDRGIYHAWNEALRHARGKWIIFLGADDFVYTEDALERTSVYLRALPPDIGVAYGRLALIARDRSTIEILGRPWSESAPRLEQVMSLPHPAVFYRRRVFERLGGFDESFRIAGDYEFLLRALRGGKAHYIADVIVSAMQAGGVSLDPANTWVVLRETYRARRLHVSPLPGPLWLVAAAKVLVRGILWRVLGERRARRWLDVLRRLAGRSPYWTVVD